MVVISPIWQDKRNCVYLPFKSNSLIIESSGLTTLVRFDSADHFLL